MAALGRILQIVGWLWVAVGFLGPILGLPFGINVLPGVIVLFISRLFRVQAARNAPAEIEPEPEPAPAPERILNTDRERHPPTPPVTTKAEQAKSRTMETEPIFKPKETESRDDMLEQILLAGREVADEPGELPDPAPLDGDPPMSSAEMIARAHKRWDKS